MSPTSQYTLILVAYFAALLLMSAWVNRRVRSRKDYFIARGRLGPATIGFSFSATQMSGSSYMGAIGNERLLGYGVSPGGVSSAAAPWFAYILMGSRLRRIAGRIECTTLVDIFEARYYSKWVNVIPTGIMLVAFIPLIAAQLKAAGNVFEVFLGVPYLTGLFIFGGLVVLYTVLGGMFAVAWTDLIQGIIMVIGFAILAPMAISAAGGFSEMNRQYALINPEGIGFHGKMPVLWVVSSFLAWGFFQIGGSPASVTRFLIPENDSTLRRAMAYSVVFQSFIYVSATMIAIASASLLPQLERTDLTVPVLVSELLPPLVGGVIVAAVLGAGMSTIDSILLLSGSLVVENVFCKFLGRELDEGRGLVIARRVTFLVGLLALLMAIRPPTAILWIVTIAFSLMASAFTFPFLLGLWWPRATREGAIVGMLGGSAVCVLWYVLGYWQHQTLNNWPGGIWPALLGPFVSLILVVSVSKWTPAPPERVLRTFFAEDEDED